MPELPPKLFFRIGEVAGVVGVEPHVLRYWEREFRSIRPTKSAKGQRVYSRKDVENLLRVRDLLYRDGFTIAGAKKKLQQSGAEPAIVAEAEPVAGATNGARVRARLTSLRAEVEAFLAELGEAPSGARRKAP
jgi:DNA-binding transcriptional MerR regulator